VAKTKWADTEEAQAEQVAQLNVSGAFTDKWLTATLVVLLPKYDRLAVGK
jgi:hypothetical protein